MGDDEGCLDVSNSEGHLLRFCLSLIGQNVRFYMEQFEDHFKH